MLQRVRPPLLDPQPTASTIGQFEDVRGKSPAMVLLPDVSVVAPHQFDSVSSLSAATTVDKSGDSSRLACRCVILGDRINHNNWSTV